MANCFPSQVTATLMAEFLTPVAGDFTATNWKRISPCSVIRERTDDMYKSDDLAVL